MTDVTSPPKINHADDEVPSGEPDETLEAMKARVEQMEREAAQLRNMQAGGYAPAATTSSAPHVGLGPGTGSPAPENEGMETEEDKEAADARSVYVGNVDYGATPEEIQAHFQSCGTINRVTILCDRFSGHPKGYAYVEFAEPTHVQHAVVLNDSMFRGRLIKVTAKRTNVPGYTRGRGRGRGGYRGGYRGGGFGYQPYRARGRGRGRGF